MSPCPECGGTGLRQLVEHRKPVMRWCFTHDSTTSDKVACHRWNLQVALQRVAGLPTEGMKSDCDIGWVACPERLEVAE